MMHLNDEEAATAIYYFAPKRSHGGLYAICIDCDPNAPQFQTIDAFNATDDGQSPPVVLFSKTWPTPAVHRVLLTNQNDTRFNPSGNSQITLDQFS